MCALCAELIYKLCMYFAVETFKIEHLNNIKHETCVDVGLVTVCCSSEILKFYRAYQLTES